MKANNNILGEFGQQIDLLNTLGGGISMTTVNVTNTPQGFVIRIKTPSLSSEAYNIEINQNQLIIYSVLPSYTPLQHSEEVNPKPIAIPSFLKVFPLSDLVDIKGIEAISEEGELRVIVPLKPRIEEAPRKIDIKHK
jgi:HSP20 family protein